MCRGDCPARTCHVNTERSQAYAKQRTTEYAIPLAFVQTTNDANISSLQTDCKVCRGNCPARREYGTLDICDPYIATNDANISSKRTIRTLHCKRTAKCVEGDCPARTCHVNTERSIKQRNMRSSCLCADNERRKHLLQEDDPDITLQTDCKVCRGDCPARTCHVNTERSIKQRNMRFLLPLCRQRTTQTSAPRGRSGHYIVNGLQSVSRGLSGTHMSREYGTLDQAEEYAIPLAFVQTTNDANICSKRTIRTLHCKRTAKCVEGDCPARTCHVNTERSIKQRNMRFLLPLCRQRTTQTSPPRGRSGHYIANGLQSVSRGLSGTHMSREYGSLDQAGEYALPLAFVQITKYKALSLSELRNILRLDVCTRQMCQTKISGPKAGKTLFRLDARPLDPTARARRCNDRALCRAPKS